MKRNLRFRFRATAFYVVLYGSALCLASVPATAQERGADTASAEPLTPIDAWLTRPHEIDLSTEQLGRVDELKTEYRAEFDRLGGDDEMAIVMQALGLEMKYRERVRRLLTPEQQTVFDENLAAQERRATASAEPLTPIDAWLTRPHEIDLSIEQLGRVDELKTEYRTEFDRLGGGDELAIVMQALGLEMKYRERVRRLLTPEQQTVFDENVRTGG